MGVQVIPPRVCYTRGMRENDLTQRNVIYGLYCACTQCKDESRIRYVGLTVNDAQARLRDHLKPYQLTKPYPVNRWKAKHGPENIRMTVLEVVDPEDDIFSREIYWVEQYKTFTDDNLGGLNRTRGGRSERSQYFVAAVREANSRDGVSWAKLNRAKAAEIRDRFDSGEPTRVISEAYGISQGHVSAIVHNEVWVDPNYVYTPRDRVEYRDPENPSWAVTRDQSREIRRDYREDPESTYSSLSAKFGVSDTAIYNVLFNLTWVDPDYQYVPKAPSPGRKKAVSESLKGRPKPAGHGERVSERVRGEGHGMGKLKEVDVIRIRQMSKQGSPQKEIAAEYGIKQAQVSRIVRGLRWGHVKEGL